MTTVANNRARVALALVHYPVLDRQGDVVTAAMTNVDVHDISRSAYTYEIDTVYVVHPISAQRALAERIREHWVEGSGGRRIPDRVGPLSLVEAVESLDLAMSGFGATELWTTSARQSSEGALSWTRAALELRRPEQRILIAFGTAWGLAPSVHARARGSLPAIQSGRRDGYNHLSVRAAVAITLDRLNAALTQQATQ